MTVTSRLHRQKDKERQRKTEENADKCQVVAPRYGVRWEVTADGEVTADQPPALVMMMMFIVTIFAGLG